MKIRKSRGSPGGILLCRESARRQSLSSLTELLLEKLLIEIKRKDDRAIS